MLSDQEPLLSAQVLLTLTGRCSFSLELPTKNFIYMQPGMHEIIKLIAICTQNTC